VKICFVGDFKRNRHNLAWAEHFQKRGYEIILVGEDDPHLPKTKFYPLKVLSLPSLRTFQRGYRLKKILNFTKPHFLHCFDSIYGYLGALCSFHPLIITLWNDEVGFFPRRNFLEKKAIIYGLQKADLVTVDAEEIIPPLKKLLSPRIPRIEYIMTGVDFKIFYPSSSPDLKKQLKIPLTAPVVTSLRSLEEEYYNIEVIISAVPLVIKKIPQVRFLILDQGKLLPHLQEKVRELRIEKAVKFIGRVPHQEMVNYLHISDVALSVPSIDATSSSLLEGMSCGVPLVVSDLPTNRRWIKNGWNGLVVPPGDKEKLAAAILQLLEDETLRKTFGQRSYQIVKEKADTHTWLRKMEDWYQHLSPQRDL
jgi:glycosyltransferase involved in cell wall biosynthesis